MDSNFTTCNRIFSNVVAFIYVFDVDHKELAVCFYVSMFYVSMFLCFYVSMFLCFYVSVFLCFCVSVFLCFCVSVFLCFCVSVFLCFCVSVFLVYLFLIKVSCQVTLFTQDSLFNVTTTEKKESS
jgi:hypothetical protein